MNIRCDVLPYGAKYLPVGGYRAKRVDHEPDPLPSEFRIRDRTQDTLSCGALHRSAERRYQYSVQKPTKLQNLVPSCLRREFVIAFRAFKAVFRIIMLRERQ